jgi:predicted DsbA family dithiol-disulfide isomerase
MKVEIFSDVACPWCYIGKRRFESALAGFEPRDQVEIVWRSYQLDPQAPKNSGVPVNEILARKYGITPQKAAAMNDQVSELAAQEGLDYHLDKTQYGNTFDAHRLLQLAATHQLQDALEERFFKAYFTEGAALGDDETLVKLAAEAGLDLEEARNALTEGQYAEAVRADLRRAWSFGIQSVPFFVIDEKYGISGAQPTEVFSKVLEQVWSEAQPRPLAKVAGVAQDDAASCEGDSCTI